MSGRTIHLIAVPWALCAGIAVGSLVYALARPYRRLGPRVHAYTLVARSRMGSGGDEVIALARTGPVPIGGVVARVLGPMLRSMAQNVSALGGTRDEEVLRRQLELAGLSNVNPKDYQLQQFLFAALGAASGVLIGLVLGTRIGILTGLCGFFLGVLRKRAEVDRRIRQRRERMRGELLSMCQVMAVYSRANPNLQQITGQVVRRSRGEIARELRAVLDSIEGGSQPEDAFARAAELTPEPAAARLYRTLSTAARAGGDIADALLAQSEDLRDAHREAKKQKATKRKTAMILTTVVLMGPPMLLFVAAPFPRLVLGR
ncbi:MAG: type II secretion system F family protein [Acidimicrobiales bacterium]